MEAFSKIGGLKSLLSISLLIAVHIVSAQKIELKRADELEGDREVRKLRGNVVFKQGETWLYCDSAFQFVKKNEIEAYNNIRIKSKDGLSITADTLYYNGNTKLARLRGDVFLQDGKVRLTTNHLNYDTDKRVGSYINGGNVIDTDNNRLVSGIGTYDVPSKTFYFRDSVRIINPDYRLEADTLVYNSASKKAYFQGPTYIYYQDKTLYAEDGNYDTRNKISNFQKNVRIDTKDYILKGDSVYYEEQTGDGEIAGKAYLFSKEDSVIIEAERAFYWGGMQNALAYGEPMMRFIHQPDTLYLLADTMVTKTDTLKDKKSLLAYNHVKIKYGELSGICDSLYYDMQDSVMYFYSNPVLWNKNSQITADSISMTIVDNTIDKMYARTNSFIISKDTIGNYNQVKGRNMAANFRDNDLRNVFVEGNGRSIYFVLEEDTIVVGMNRVVCSNMRMLFEQNQVQSITFITEPDANFIPPKEVMEPDKKLKGFQWRANERPGIIPFFNRMRYNDGIDKEGQ